MVDRSLINLVLSIVFSFNTSGAARNYGPSNQDHVLELRQPERHLALGRLRHLLFLVGLTPSEVASAIRVAWPSACARQWLQ